MSEGFKKLIVWQNAYKLRKRIYDITERFPKDEIRRVSQMRDAARSVKQNIQEGYQKNSTKEYVRSLEISKGSLSELLGDVEDSYDDRLIIQEEFEELRTLCKQTSFLFYRLILSLRRKIQGVSK